MTGVVLVVSLRKAAPACCIRSSLCSPTPMLRSGARAFLPVRGACEHLRQASVGAKGEERDTGVRRPDERGVRRRYARSGGRRGNAVRRQNTSQGTADEGFHPQGRHDQGERSLRGSPLRTIERVRLLLEEQRFQRDLRRVRQGLIVEKRQPAYSPVAVAHGMPQVRSKGERGAPPLAAERVRDFALHGEQGRSPEELVQAFIASGTMHLLAVSGCTSGS